MARRALTLALVFGKNKGLLLKGLEELAASGGSNAGVQVLINRTRADLNISIAAIKRGSSRRNNRGTSLLVVLMPGWIGSNWRRARSMQHEALG
jgi:hypothetical protein